MSGLNSFALRLLVALALLLPAGAAERPAPRKTLRIGRAWNLTAEKHDRTETEGTKVHLLTSTGHVTLKHGPNMFRGPWDIDAKADTVETDFVGQKFVLKGSPVVQQKGKDGAVLKTYTGEAGAVLEIQFTELGISARDPKLVKIEDGPGEKKEEGKKEEAGGEKKEPGGK